jgi:hypothetical protein
VGPPVDLTPASAPTGRAGQRPAASDAPIPPAPIPNAEPGQRTNNFLNKIFGTL